MSDKLKSFYEEWANRQLEDSRRQHILEWKAREMAPLVRRSGLQINSAMELGCAEGVVLNGLGANLNITTLYGVDLSEIFVEVGQKRYPHITFLNQKWEQILQDDLRVDLLLISDFIEHLPDPDLFLDKIMPLAKYFIFKIPLEKCVMISLYQTLGRRAKIGVDHPSGHLHEYTERQALNLLKAHGYKILQAKSLSTPFELQYAGLQQWYKHPSVVVEKLANTLPMSWQIGLIGGSLFTFCARPENN